MKTHLLILLIVIISISCGEKENGGDNLVQPPTNTQEQVENVLTKYYLPITDWGRSKNEVKKICQTTLYYLKIPIG